MDHQAAGDGIERSRVEGQVTSARVHEFAFMPGIACL
jgi:hypothetical protein